MNEELVDRLSRKPTINVGTHDGIFHADDVLCVAMLKVYFNTQNIKVTRSRKIQLLQQCDIVVDAGNGEFDHHQPPFELYKSGVKMAACGKLARALYDVEVFKELGYFLEPIEARDNGQILQWLKGSSIAFVSSFVPGWDEDGSQLAMQRAFDRAVGLVVPIFERELRKVESKIKAREEILKVSEIREDLMVLDKYIAWQEYTTGSRINWVIYPNNTGEWNLQAVPKSTNSVLTHHSTPISWRGKYGGELELITGIFGATFCHSNGHLAAFKTKSAAIRGYQASKEWCLKKGGRPC